jgi:hypothetical protein
MERLVSGSRWTDSGHVFTTLRGTPYHAATITRAFKAAMTRAGLPTCRFHDLRHSAATFVLAQGMTLEDVKQLLGHSSITLTSNTYAHVLEQRQRQVARAMGRGAGRVATGEEPSFSTRQASRPSRTRRTTTPSAATGSAVHQPNRALRLIPAITTTDRKAGGVEGPGAEGLSLHVG